ncbi:MAG: DUF4382 domain-containing protein [Bacteroidia bacterium]|nr:DUF4382 domain-containing protein [Bacteroidia bacterium]
MMINSYYSRFIPLFILVLSLFAACEEGSLNPNDPNGKGLLQINLTDNPGDFDQVNIDLQQVEVKMRDSSGFQEVNTYAGIYDLLQLQDGVDTLIVRDSIPLNEIQQVRLILGADNSIMVDSILYPMDTPSAQQSGLKINLNRMMGQDSLNSVLLDFDAAESVVEKGNGTYSLKPVIKVLR